jgi:adenine deaminase
MILRKKFDVVERKNLIDVCMSLKRPSLALVGGQVVDLILHKIKKADVIIEGERVAFVGDVKRVLEPYNVVEVDGKFLIPGLIDAHAHVESVMVTPSVYSSLVIPQGTVCAIVDPHEIANVSGVEGLKAFLKECEMVPFKFYLQTPSCVPSSTGLETSGHILGAVEVREMIEYGFQGLGEVMDYRRLVEGEKEILEKIKFVYENNGVIDGHCPKVTGATLQAYAAGCIMSDHTARRAEEILDKVGVGFYVMIQDRPGESAFEEMVDVIKTLDVNRICFCTDDIEPDVIVEKGHLLSTVKKAIDFGLDPIRAIQMATLNPAILYGIQWDLGIIAPGRYADILVLDDLKEFSIEKVMVNGNVAALNKRLTIKIEKTDSFSMFKNTVKLKNELAPADLVIKVDAERGNVYARILTLEGEVEEEVLEIMEYEVSPNPLKNIVRIAVLERHGKNGNIGKGFIKGLGIKRGAIASSVSHDSHNITVAGVCKEDMYIAVKEIEKSGGGLVVVDERRCLAKVSLPYFGLLSDNINVVEELKKLRKAASLIGFNIPLRRFMFLTLPVGRGKFKITDKGIVDYEDKTIFSPIISLIS